MFARDSTGYLSWNIKQDAFNKPHEFVSHPFAPNTAFPERILQKPELPSRNPPYTAKANSIPLYDENVNSSDVDMVAELLK